MITFIAYIIANRLKPNFQSFLREEFSPKFLAKVHARFQILKNDFQSLMECISLQVIMKFKKDFWKMKMERADYFGVIPDSPEKRGFSYLFYDVSNKVIFRFLSNC